MRNHIKQLFLFSLCLAVMLLLACSQYRLQPIRIGIASSHFPWEVRDAKQNSSGFSIDLIQAFSEKTQLPIELVWLEPSELFDALDESRVDCLLSSIPIQENKLSDYIMSDPYTKIFDILLFNSQSHVRSKSDLNHNNVKIAVVTGSYHENLARRNFSNAEIISFNSYDEATSSLQRQETDALIDDAPSLIYTYAKNASTFSINPAPISDDFQYLVVYAKPDHQNLIDQWNHFFSKARKDGTLDTLSDKYLAPLKWVMDQYDLPLNF